MKDLRRNTLLFSTLGLLLMSVPSVFAGHYVQVSDDLKIFYEESGSGSPIIFVPGWTMTTEFFSHQLSYFSKNYRVISFDPRSQGRSSRMLQNNNYTQHGKDLQVFMQELGLVDVILVGWSYGCLDAYSYVRQAGIENVRAFVCIDNTPKPLWTKEGDWAEGQVADFKRNYDRMTQDRVAFGRTFAQSMVKRALNPKEQDWIVHQSWKTSADVELTLFLDAMFSDYTAEARMMNGQLPVLNFLHQEEGWTEMGQAWLTANVPSSGVVVLKAHMMFWEQPDEFNAALDRFLRTVETHVNEKR